MVVLHWLAVPRLMRSCSEYLGVECLHEIQGWAGSGRECAIRLAWRWARSIKAILCVCRSMLRLQYRHDASIKTLYV